MIVTLTANPSLDRTIELPGALARGDVQRAVAAHQEPGGKGVNVSRALTVSAVPTVAVLPGDPEDAVLAGLRAAQVPYRNLPIGRPLRSNITLTEPDGTTTKLNEPGPTLDELQQDQLIGLLLEACGDRNRPAEWVVLAGSLPPGVPVDFYARVTRCLRGEFGAAAPKVAVDSSGAPLEAAVAGGRDAAPDLIKPNAEELAELAGYADFADWRAFEADPLLAVRAARALLDGGVGAVLATLGAKGAVLVTAEGQWRAVHAPVTARSTVGAGDSSLAGYLLAHSAGGEPEACLRQAVAHGAAAASLPGSTMPTLQQTTPAAVTVTALHPQRASAAHTSEGG
jgi:1-phosphofructokinase